MQENNYPEGVSQTVDRFVEPFQGTVIMVNVAWGGAAARLTPGYWMKRLRRKKRKTPHHSDFVAMPHD